MFPSLTGFWQKKEHLKLWHLTYPMILANITTPLLGLVDTAVLGHLPGRYHLAGAAIGAFILTQVYWICGFVRMSATGLSAQAKGAADLKQMNKVLSQGAVVGLALGLLLVLLQTPLLNIGLYFAQAEPQVNEAIVDYYQIRVWGAPAAMTNLALIGWLIGQQCSKQVMWVQVLANLLNAALDMLFVYGFEWGVSGVALASVCAEYSILLLSVWAISKQLRRALLSRAWFAPEAIKPLLSLNTDILIRNLALQACLAFMTFQGARLGELAAATNAILMQFFVLIALGLDAVAYGVEALIGEAKGANNNKRVQLVAYRGLFWSGAFALAYAAVFGIFAIQIIGLLSADSGLQQSAEGYRDILIWLPLIAHWCFLYDGVFVGLSDARAMRNSMLLSALLGFFPIWYWLADWGNRALWFALLAFLLARGISLGSYFAYAYPARREQTCD